MALQSLVADKEASSLDLDDIQGDILLGLQKENEMFVFFTIKDADAFKKCAARAVKLGLITSTREVAAREEKIALLKDVPKKPRLPLLGANIGLTFRGLSRLRADSNLAATFPDLDPSFVRGAVGSAEDLGDDIDIWSPRFRKGNVDGVLLVTGPSPELVTFHAAELLHLFDEGIDNSVAMEPGNVRPPQRGHEHFGFLDGVSQPGIRGLTKPENAKDPEQGLPGQDLIWPGEFVFGQSQQVKPEPETATSPAKTATKEEEGPVATPPAPWMNNGSYMVWRKLEQRVLAFREETQAKAAALGMDADLLRARMVGRWPSGAPIVKSPTSDDAALGEDKMLNNDFEFQASDPHQRVCPYAAHIRKTYPRDDLNDAEFGGSPLKHLVGESGEAEIQTRRIRRAGIPFGPELDTDKEFVSNEASRGLMFVCYQTSIVEQFEFIQASWANNSGFVIGKKRPSAPNDPVAPGHDLIIAQVDDRFMDEPISNHPMGDTRSKLEGTSQFVHSRGAAYFFMPSLSALANGLA